jgi:hypothetical protein
MRQSRILVAFGIVAAVIGIAANAGATTQSAPRPKIAHAKKLDLSSLAKIRAYLRSRGVNPSTVVIQRGSRNYAGPKCPGRRWTCTTARRVLQVGSENFFDCTGGTTQTNAGGTQTCIGLTQEGETNTFRCVERTSGNPAFQRCGVTQIGVSNYAYFEQVADQSTSTLLDQTANQLVEVHQETQAPAVGETSAPKNELHIFQRAKQRMTTGTTDTTEPQMQDAHQFVIPTTVTPTSSDRFSEIQDATAGGNNYSEIHEYTDQGASGAAIAQKQNTKGLPTVDNFTFEDCAPLDVAPTEPNQCVEGSQTASGTGENHSQVHQLIDEDARSTLAANQTQGQAEGGIDARVHQEVGGTVGFSKSHADQAMRQNVSGAQGSTQVQTDPGSCCGISQLGGDPNMTSQNIDGASAQNSDQLATQNATLIGQCNTEEGSCSAQHHGKNDSDNQNFSQSCQSGVETPCAFVLITQCNSQAVEGGGSAGACGPPPPCSEPPCLTGPALFTATNFLPATPLTGYEVTMGLIEPSLALPL